MEGCSDKHQNDRPEEHLKAYGRAGPSQRQGQKLVVRFLTLEATGVTLPASLFRVMMYMVRMNKHT